MRLYGLEEVDVQAGQAIDAGEILADAGREHAGGAEPMIGRLRWTLAAPDPHRQGLGSAAMASVTPNYEPEGNPHL
jgi:hypothetical protein